MAAVAPQGLYRFDRLDIQVLLPVQGELAGQGHYLVPTIGGPSRIHIEYHYHAAPAVGGRRRRMNARWSGRAEVELAIGGCQKFVPPGIVITQEVLAAAHVTEK